MDAFEDLLAANRAHAQRAGGATVPGRAARGLALVTCMDARIAPLEVLGLAVGDAKVLRNAGGRVTDDVLRALVLAVHLLDVDRVMVLAHTDCRMAGLTDAGVHGAIAAHGVDSRSLVFGTTQDQLGTLVQDVQRIRSSPYLTAGLPVVGGILDVASGLVDVVVPLPDDARS